MLQAASIKYWNEILGDWNGQEEISQMQGDKAKMEGQ